MKTLLTKFIAVSSIPLLMLTACKKNDPIIKTKGGTAGSLTASTTTPVLDKTKLNDTTKVINFSFSKSTYEFKAAVSTTLQIDSMGDNWKKPQSFTIALNANSQGFSTNDFNSLMLKLNLHAGVASQVQARIQYSLGGASTPIYSNVLTLTVTPFNLTSWLYVVGAFDGWPTLPAKGTDSLVSVTGNGVYTGIINFPAGANQFLILPQSNNYNNKYATNQPVTQTTSTVTVNGGNNLVAPATAGYYVVTFNANTNAISFAPANFYSVIGDGAIDWNTDVPMKYLNDGTSTWTVTTALKSSGSIKIRQNDDWTYSWGIPKPGTAGDGIPNTLNDNNDNNIPVPTNGTYTVTFTIPLAAQGSGTPPVTATYTLK
ncbi:MAG: SusE domain-containing protein [Mucilaginibacter sp.]|jgi:hypothetical protein